MSNGKSAIFIDIDGCLISDFGNVNADYYQALSDISEWVKRGDLGEGPTVRLCTARNINSVELMCNVLGIVNSFVIIGNGVALLNPTTRKIKLNPDITDKMKELFRKILRRRIPLILKRWSNLSVYPGNILNITLERESETTPDMEIIHREIRKGKMIKYLIRRRIIKIVCSRYTISIVPRRINKGSGVKFLADVDNIDLSQSLAIGDTSQDFSLFRQVRLIGCPANASDQCKRFVKERRGRVSHFSCAQGVADIIKHFLEK